MKRFAAGKDCDSYCGKCKMLLAHVIHAMDAHGRTPVRVECKTCGGVHKYKGHLPGEAPRKSASGTSRARKSATASKTMKRGLFEDLAVGMDISAPSPYRIDQDFEKDTVILHKKFGLGLVTRALDGGKVEVAFRDEIRILVHQR